VFALLPSNTRLAEQGHGMGRYKLTPGRSIAIDDALMSHSFEGYAIKEKVQPRSYVTRIQATSP